MSCFSRSLSWREELAHKSEMNALHMQNVHLPSSVLSRLWVTVSDSWATTAPASYTHLASGRHAWWRCMGVWAYVNVVSYHVGNKRKTRSNPIFCNKGPDVKVGNVWGLNRNCSDRSHLLFGVVKTVTLQVFRNCVCRSIASFVRVLASLSFCLPQISGWSI